MMCQACEAGDHDNCGMQTWCECDCEGPPDGVFLPDNGPDHVFTCWCGATGTYEELFDDTVFEQDCGGSGTLHCECGGDNMCVCHHHGEVECPGCPDCDAEDSDDFDYDDDMDDRADPDLEDS